MTSGALILMFASQVLSSGPGFEIKSFAVGIAAGIIFDGTVIRALLVPALMKLFVAANWCMPDWARTGLRLPQLVPPPLIDLRKQANLAAEAVAGRAARGPGTARTVRVGTPAAAAPGRGWSCSTGTRTTAP